MKKRPYNADEEINESFWQEYGQAIVTGVVVILCLGSICAALYFTFSR